MAARTDPEVRMGLPSPAALPFTLILALDLIATEQEGLVPVVP